MNLNVVVAIFKRNLISYFSTPTGYVFICLFVFLCSLAAFWPQEFFNANLANLDQLNGWIASILLIFIPAITMSIWADERRQGTDELLLTIPASDLDVVLGKFLAASGIFSISLLFSMACNISVLLLLADWQLDYTQFLCTYLGYWLMGEAMLAVGMVASFLTSNLTVAFILGALLNLPLASAHFFQEGTLSENTARTLRNWSYTGQFLDFGRGVLSLSGLVFFLSIVIIALYLCMVLIGRRHWSGGKDGNSMGWHYVVRCLGLLLALVGINALVGGHALGRVDVSQDQVNSLSPESIKVLANLNADQPVRVEAYFSPKLPEAYQRQRIMVETFLREMEKHSGGKLRAKIVELEPNTDEAYNAEQKYEITQRKMPIMEANNARMEDMYMGLAFTGGLNKQVIPFLGKDAPVEYELMRCIWAVNQSNRKKVGLLGTDAINRAPDMMRMRNNESSFSELQRHLRSLYEVISIDATNEIPLTTVIEEEDPKTKTKTKKTVQNYDVVVAIQPSTLSPTALSNFVNLVKAGQATLILEDPMPQMAELTGTYGEKRPRGSPFGMPPPPEPKGNIEELWKVLGVEFDRYDKSYMTKLERLVNQRSLSSESRLSPEERDTTKILWSNYTPDKKLQNLDEIPKQFAWIASSDESAKEPFNSDSKSVAGLTQLLIPFAGAIVKRADGTTKTKYLVRTGQTGGTIAVGAINLASARRNSQMLQNFEERVPDKEFVIAMEIKGQASAKSLQQNLPMADEGSPAKAANVNQNATPATGPQPVVEPAAPTAKIADLNVILVADADLIVDQFFQIRDSRPDQLRIDNDNVTMVLNMIDTLSKQTDFVELRKKGVKVRPLVLIDNILKTNIDEVSNEEQRFTDSLTAEVTRINDEYQRGVQTLEAELSKVTDENSSSFEEIQQKMELYKRNKSKEATEKIRDLQETNLSKINKLRRDLNKNVRSKQEWYKGWAALLPPIPPLLVAFFVFFSRKAREREGVNQNRLR